MTHANESQVFYLGVHFLWMEMPAMDFFFMFYARNGSIIVADEMYMSTFDALVNIFSSECKRTQKGPLHWRVKVVAWRGVQQDLPPTQT